VATQAVERVAFRRQGGTVTDLIPRALHRGQDELPFVALGDGSELQVLQIDLDRDLWVVRMRFAPGTQIQTHRHTGDVFAFTLSGSWHYLEYPEVNRAGSYLFEPKGSTHTLHVPSTNDGHTDVVFAVFGKNENLDADGNVTSVWDAQFIWDGYRMLCEAQGFPEPHPILGE
jgi:quercetin dioxygenase-like cupin family protein